MEVSTRKLTERPQIGRRRVRRVTLVAFTASVAIHALALALRFDAAVPDPGPAAVRRAPHHGSVTTRLIDIVTVPSQPVRDGSARRTLTPALEPRTPTTDVFVRAGDSPRIGGGEGSDPHDRLVDRILPRSHDPRLLGEPTRAIAPSVDRLDATRTRIGGSIETLNDSTAAAAEADRRIMDWTRTDAQGNRWGISPGTVYLGASQLKLCGGNFNPADCGFVPPPGQRELLKARLGTFNAIRSQAERAELDRTFDERARAIRARGQASRDSTRQSQ